jgi:hypothetical protein
MYIHRAFSVISGASSVEIWHLPRIGREKGGRVRMGEEEGMTRGQKASIVRNFTTKLDWAAVYYPHARTRAKTTCCLH